MQQDLYGQLKFSGKYYPIKGLLDYLVINHNDYEVELFPGLVLRPKSWTEIDLKCSSFKNVIAGIQFNRWDFQRAFYRELVLENLPNNYHLGRSGLLFCNIEKLSLEYYSFNSLDLETTLGNCIPDKYKTEEWIMANLFSKYLTILHAFMLVEYYGDDLEKPRLNKTYHENNTTVYNDKLRLYGREIYPE